MTKTNATSIKPIITLIIITNISYYNKATRKMAYFLD